MAKNNFSDYYLNSVYLEVCMNVNFNQSNTFRGEMRFSKAYMVAQNKIAENVKIDAKKVRSIASIFNRENSRIFLTDGIVYDVKTPYEKLVEICSQLRRDSRVEYLA